VILWLRTLRVSFVAGYRTEVYSWNKPSHAWWLTMLTNGYMQDSRLWQRISWAFHLPVHVAVLSQRSEGTFCVHVQVSILWSRIDPWRWRKPFSSKRRDRIASWRSFIFQKTGILKYLHIYSLIRKLNVFCNKLLLLRGYEVNDCRISAKG